MNLFLFNVTLALIWAAWSGSFSLLTLFTGYGIGFAVLWLLQPLMGGPNLYFLRAYYWLRLLVMFHYELIVSSLVVVWDVLTPTQHSVPGIVDVPLDIDTEIGILLVTNLISLTPGTLSLDVSEDRKTLYVHAMFSEDPQALRDTLKNGMERWVKEAIET
ncbi:Na(+)/H(+) antiporter subunit E [Pseudoruegeria aquimaris]|uniref:Na(+)/H(+) antiporter subunit E n=1 Tax=Pseudoruegeria aquimaris TaxID=393663 RepID=A0A1Y5R9J3_9RHOB|nr:Na+/H+ antiporter subunit E [Pseudoruegeria aquimaris]SLN12327.1 Na(+)/H(+) antiporter subunit E [Pseudoruegeria aquimaris]